jgi:NAD(P)-dependent dehydrogenase (short-subunit alcohol dehydrogenase family)
MTVSVVITGGFGALGAATARAFAKRGDRVNLVDRMQSIPERIATEFRPPHRCIPGIDLTDGEAAAHAMQESEAAGGGLDALVNIAGGFEWQPVMDGDASVWQRMFAANLLSAVVATRAALPYLLAAPAGRVVTIGAGAAQRAAAGMGAYTASKAGIERFTESLAEEVKDRGMTANAILPGTIDTPRNRADMPDADTNRWVAPEAVADVILFLVSDAGRAVNGASIRVFGRG